MEKIKEIFYHHKKRYGYRRITLELKNQGYIVNHKKVYRLMVKLGLKPLKRNKRKYSSYKGTVGKIANNLIEREFYADKPNEKWYTDVTEFNLRGEKCYLSPILDGFNGEVISHNISKSPNLAQIKDILDKVFYKKENLFLRDTIFVDNQDYYAKLRKLHAQKIELQRLKSLVTLPKPFVIEFTGTPRTGKTTIINNLYDFFKKGGFEVSLIEEFTTSKYYKEELRSKFDSMSYSDRDLAIFEEIYKQLQNAVLTKKDLILIDRSLNDRQIWNYRRLVRGDMPEDLYLNAREKYSKLSKQLIDFLVVTYADSLTSLRRDYNSSLALENRRFLNEANLNEYNESLQALKDLFIESVDSVVFLDTTKMSINDVSIEVVSQVLPVMRKRYIKAFQQKYN